MENEVITLVNEFLQNYDCESFENRLSNFYKKHNNITIEI